MKKLIFSLLTASASLVAAPQAVIFDWGDVLATNDRSVVVQFMCKELQLSEEEFEKANVEKRNALKEGKSETDFWIEHAKSRSISLPANWGESYTAAIKASVGTDPAMYAIIDKLKEKKIQVGILSNINDRYVKLIRDFGFYEPFTPCLLSCEMGLEKPDPKAYELLLQALALPGEKVVFIDDKIENIEGAKKFGIDAILFQSAEQVREELVKRDCFTK